MVEIVDSDDDEAMTTSSNATSSTSSRRGEGGSPGEWIAVTEDSTPSNGWEEVVVTLQGTSGTSTSSSTASASENDGIQRGDSVHDHDDPVSAASATTRDFQEQPHGSDTKLSSTIRDGDQLGSARHPILLDFDNLHDEEGNALPALDSPESLNVGERGWTTDDAEVSSISSRVQDDEMEVSSELLRQEIHWSSPSCSRNAVVADDVEGSVTEAQCTDNSTGVSEEDSEQRLTVAAVYSSHPFPALSVAVDTMEKYVTPVDRSERVTTEAEAKSDGSPAPLASFDSLGLYDKSGEEEAAQVVRPTVEMEDFNVSNGEENVRRDVVVDEDLSIEDVLALERRESIQEDATVTDAKILDEAVLNETAPAATGNALLDLELLCQLLERTQDAGDALDGQDVLLFIGGTGSGKTTSLLYCAGALFEEEDSTGFFHYNPIEFPSEHLQEFKVGPGGQSITKTICAARTRLEDGTEVVLVDTPGFSDTDGAEYDIANGLGLIRALQRAKSIRPVLVFNAQLFGDRFRSLSETLDTVNRMTDGTKKVVDFSKFRYLFTRCEGREVRLIHRKLSMFIESLLQQDADSVKGQLLPLLQDMQRKTTPTALAFDPLDSEGRFQLLHEMWRNADTSSALKPSDFYPFMSLGVEEKLRGELERRFAILEHDCSCGNLQLVQENLSTLRRLSIVLPEAEGTTSRAVSFFESFLSRICKTILLRFKYIWLIGFDGRDELRDMLDEVKNEIDKLSRVPEECHILLLNRGQTRNYAVTELFQDVLRASPRVEPSLSSNDIHAVQKTLYLLKEVSNRMGGFTGGKSFSIAFLQAFDKCLAHATAGLQDVELWLAANTIVELRKIESPMSFAFELLSFLRAEDIAGTEGRAVLDRSLEAAINAIHSRMNRSRKQIATLFGMLKSSLSEEREIGRAAIAKVEKVCESRTLVIALCQMKSLGFLSVNDFDLSAVNELDTIVINVLSTIPKLAFKKIRKLESLFAESTPFDFEDQRKPLFRSTEAVNSALTLCGKIQQWPCIDLPRNLWEHLTSAKSGLRASLEKLDEYVKLIERGFAEAMETATKVSNNLTKNDEDASTTFIELFDHWEAWESLLDAVEKSKGWFSLFKRIFGTNSSAKQNPLDLVMRKIVGQVHGLLSGSLQRINAMRDSEPFLLLQECPKDVCFFLAFIRTPSALSLGPRVLNSRGWLRPMAVSAFRKVVASIDKINRMPLSLLSDHMFDRVDLFLRRLDEAQDWTSVVRSLASRIVYSDCIVKTIVGENELEALNKSLFEMPTTKRVLEDVEQAVNELSSKVEKLSLMSACHLTVDHERMDYFQDVTDLLSACSTASSVSGHLNADPNVAAFLYQNLLQRIDSDLLAFRNGLQSLTASFPDDPSTFTQINCHLSSLSSFEQCFADVKPLLASKACQILTECCSAVFGSLELRSSTPLTSDCGDFATYLVVLKKSSREVAFWKTEVDRFIDKMLNKRVAHSEKPESFLLDLSLALRRIDGDDAVVAEQLLWDHGKFQGVLTSIFSEATAGQDVTYVLNGLDLSAEQRQKLEQLYSSFLDRYTNKVLDGVSAFRSRDESLLDFLSNLVLEALEVSKDVGVGFCELTLQLSSSLFAYWSLSNLSDLVLLESQCSSLSKYVMRPHAAQVIACWIMLNIHDANEFHTLKHHLIELKTGEGKSIILGVVATILAVWGYSVDVLCYSSYLSQRDFKAFQKMFSDFGVSRWIWYGTLWDLPPRIMGSDYFGKARAAIEGSGGNTSRRVPFRPSVLLIDEVDIFFSADVFGSQARRSCSFSPSPLVDLMKAVWQRSATRESTGSILNLPEVRQCLAELPPTLHEYFNQSISEMQHAASVVRKDRGVRYHVIADKIAYKYFDGVQTRVYYGFETHFHYIKEWEKGNISTASMKSKVEELLYRVALTSYAEFPFAFDLTLGITGTLRALSAEERRIVEDMYGIRSHSYIPSVFGRNKLVFAGDQESDFKLCDTQADHVFELKHELISRRESVVESQNMLRPVMIFFDRRDTLLKFHSSTLMENLKRQVAVVTEETPTYEKDSLFLKATEAGAITLMVREFGRGTDFKCFDRRVLDAGGVHVIQAFFSKELSEEIQIKGRCARQGAAGSFSMVLNIEDLQRDFAISQTEVESMRRRRELYSYVHEKRTAVCTTDLTKRKECVAAAEDAHYRTLACKEALETGFEEAKKRREIISFFNELNGLGESRSFIRAGLKESIISKRLREFEKFKAEDRKKRSNARETLLLEASIADKKRLETRERLKADNVTHYLVLGLSQDASAEDEKRAFHELSVLFHPDKCKDDDATEIFRKVREAHDVLSCDAKRAAYDAEIA